MKLFRIIAAVGASAPVLACGTAAFAEDKDNVEVPLGDIYAPYYSKLDINSDKAVDVQDVTALQKHIAAVPGTTVNYAVLDTNGDGRVDISDATYIQKVLDGTIVPETEPVTEPPSTIPNEGGNLDDIL